MTEPYTLTVGKLVGFLEENLQKVRDAPIESLGGVIVDMVNSEYKQPSAKAPYETKVLFGDQEIGGSINAPDGSSVHENTHEIAVDALQNLLPN